MGVRVLKPPVKNSFICCNKHHNRAPHRALCCAKGPRLYIGTEENVLNRALLQFDLSLLPNPVTILTSTLYVFLKVNFFPGEPHNLSVYQVLSDWKMKCVNWKRQPLINPVPVAGQIITNQEQEFISFDITPLTFQWYTNQAANFGVMLKMENENIDNLIAVSSKKSKNSQFWPFIEVAFLDPKSDNDYCRILDQTFKVTTGDDIAYTDYLITLPFDYSYIPVNIGENSAQCYLQISSDGMHWQTESEVKTVLPHQSVSLVPDTIGKYSRLCYRSVTPGASTVLVIYVQGRA
ncbi:hypothetical protein SCACP_34240 [Sporomusa carbonis]|uniref:DNRLRE domain-containing protein n=1 Tax=Sporomusa carbonis TaxID=3076075 RepID=UPI003A76818E